MNFYAYFNANLEESRLTQPSFLLTRLQLQNDDQMQDKKKVRISY
jgi:hypothetical protein